MLTVRDIRKSSRRPGVAALALLLAVAHLPAEETPDSHGPRPAGEAEARARHEAARMAHRGNPDVLVLPGLVADRKARTVEVLAECTGLDGGETIEFLLVGSDSSHGYEALLWSWARPGDVRRGLVFIGLRPGQPADPVLPRLRPDGDRVRVGVRGEADRELLPVESLILDNETGKTLPEEGFAFTGSMRVPPPGGAGDAVLAAEVTDPRSIVSIFSDPVAVLEVPRRVEQGEAYGRQVVNPEYVEPGGTLLTVVMTPDPDAARDPSPPLVLRVDAAAGATGLVHRLATTNGLCLAEAPTLVPVMEKLSALAKGGAPPRLTPAFGASVPLADVARASAMLGILEALGLVGVEPPAAGQLYHRAFTPERTWAEPEGRPSQPWELHLRRRDGKVTGVMTWQEAVWSDASPLPAFRPRTFAAATPADVRARLDADRRAREAAGETALPAVLLVYAPAALPYGELLAFVRPVLGTHGTVYVFVEEEPEEGP